MDLTGQQYLELIGHRVRAVHARILDLADAHDAGIRRQDALIERYDIQPDDRTFFARAGQWITSPIDTWRNSGYLLQFYVEEGARQAPYYNRLQTAVNELKAARDRVRNVTIITHAQIAAVNEAIRQANVNIRRGRLLYNIWRESEMGRIYRGDTESVVLETLFGIVASNVGGRVVEFTSDVVMAVPDAITGAARSQQLPPWMKYTIAAGAFGLAGYLYTKAFR